MAHKDALTDSVTIVTIGTTKDNIGQETKSETALYTDVPCRLMEAGSARRSDEKNGAFENFRNQWLIQMSAQYNGANRGDRATVNGVTYLITKKHEIRGTTPTIEYVNYYLQEKT